MDKYVEALNSISNYEIWHDATYDDGYCNDDDWTEYPFDDSEDIKLLSKLTNKYDILNKGIDELLIKYEETYQLYSDKKFGDAVIYKSIITDLKKLKGSE